jgi:hypothetical protein
MLYHAVIAMKRSDFSEAVVSLHRNIADAQRVACRLAAVSSQKIVRYRIRPVDLSASQIEAICFEWGQEDAQEGKPLLAHLLPQPYAVAYRHGYRVGKNLARPEGQA